MFEIYSSNQKRNWDSKQKRCYHRLNSILLYWETHEYQLLRIDLTSSEESNRLKLRLNYRLLRREAEKVFGYKEIENFVVETNEGNGVLHTVWAWKDKEGYKSKRFFINQSWLSLNWSKFHLSPIVWVRKYDISCGSSRKKVSRYFVSQYVSGQSEFVRYSYSWKRTFGFSLTTYWVLFKDYWLNYAGADYAEMLVMWELFVTGRKVPDVVRGAGYWFLTIDELRGMKIS